MKRFITKVTILFSILGGLILTGEIFVRSLPNPYKYKDQWMKTYAQDVETLILGTSQSEMGLPPQILGENCFNLAMPNGLFEYDLFLLQKYANKYNNMKNIIIELSYYNLFAQEFETSAKNKYRAMYYRVYMDYPKHKFDPIYNFEFADLDFFQYRISTGIESKLLGKPYADICDSLGWVCIDRCAEIEDPNYFVTDMEKTLKSYKCTDFSVIEKNKEYIDRIISFSKKKGYMVYVVVLPMTKTILTKLDKEQYRIFCKTIQNYEKQNIRIINHIDDSLFHVTDFQNSNHLNKNGALKFASILKQEMIQDNIKKNLVVSDKKETEPNKMGTTFR